MKILEGLDKAAFTQDFLKAYLQYGFAAMTKREIDLLVLRLLVEHKDGWSWADPPNAFEMAQALKTKRSRLRSMMDELSFRMFDDKEQARERLRKLIDGRIQEKGDELFEENRVRIQIEDGFLREFAKEIVQKDYGIVDSSFNSSIIVLSGEKFLALVFEVISESAKDEIEKELKKHRKSLAAPNDKGLLRVFFEQAVKGAGDEAGKQAVKFGITALTGGTSEIPEFVKWFIKKMKRDVDGSEVTADSVKV